MCNLKQEINKMQALIHPPTWFSKALVATYPEINDPVVQFGVLVNSGSAFLRENQEHHHITKKF